MTNTVTFRYNENNEPEEVMLLDLQICRITSLGIDLNHTIYSSTTEPMRRQYLIQMLQDYYEVFSETVKNSETKMPFTIEELREEFVRKNMFGYTFGIRKYFFHIFQNDLFM